MNRKSTLIPEPIAQPARQHGVYAVAHPLRLDYTEGRRSYAGRS